MNVALGKLSLSGGGVGLGGGGRSHGGLDCCFYYLFCLNSFSSVNLHTTRKLYTLFCLSRKFHSFIALWIYGTAWPVTIRTTDELSLFSKKVNGFYIANYNLNRDKLLWTFQYFFLFLVNDVYHRFYKSNSRFIYFRYCYLLDVLYVKSTYFSFLFHAVYFYKELKSNVLHKLVLLYADIYLFIYLLFCFHHLCN